MFTIEFLIGSAVWLVVLIFVRRYESAHEGKSVSSAFGTDAGTGASCDELFSDESEGFGSTIPASGLSVLGGDGSLDAQGNPFGLE